MVLLSGQHFNPSIKTGYFYSNVLNALKLLVSRNFDGEIFKETSFALSSMFVAIFGYLKNLYCQKYKIQGR